jgi:flavin reductase (DIM6/NTAB) family NADH-FMN oxidoreductase RutF
MRWPEIGKLRTARWVEAPYIASAGTSISPMESRSMRVALEGAVSSLMAAMVVRAAGHGTGRMDGPDGARGRAAEDGGPARPLAPTRRPVQPRRSPRPSARILRRVSVQSAEFRAAIGQFATGVTIVTALDGDRPVGITVNAFASMSLEPALVAIALDHRRFIVPFVEADGRYAVNILAEDQQWLSDCFAGANVTPSREAFCGARWHPGQTGLPLLAGAIASIECRVVERIALGDHRIFVGSVEAVTMAEPDAPPLLYHRRRYLRIERASTAQVIGKPESAN